VLGSFVYPYVVSFLEAGDFTTKGKLLSALKAQIPLLIVGIVLGAVCICVLYLTAFGQETLKAGGGLLGVLIGLNIVTGLIWLSLILGWGLVKIPISTFKYSRLESKQRYWLYKVAYH